MCYVMDGLWRVLCDCRYVECCVIGGMWKTVLCDGRYVKGMLCDWRCWVVCGESFM